MIKIQVLVTGGPSQLRQQMESLLTQEGFAVQTFAADFDLRQREDLAAYLTRTPIKAIVHCAEFFAPENNKFNPGDCYDFYIGGILSLMNAMLKSKVTFLASAKRSYDLNNTTLKNCFEMETQMMKDASQAYAFEVGLHLDAHEIIELLKRIKL